MGWGVGLFQASLPVIAVADKLFMKTVSLNILDDEWRQFLGICWGENVGAITDLANLKYTDTILTSRSR